MFQPQPTPYAPFFPYGLHVANAGLPDYSFEATPLLGQFGGGHVGGSVAAGDGDGGGVSALVRAYTTAAPSNAFHASASGGSGGPAGMGLGLVQGLGLPLPTALAAPSSNSNSAAYRHSGGSSSASSAHPGLYNPPMSAVPMPRHHHHQHPLPHQNQLPPPQHHQPQSQHRRRSQLPHAPTRSIAGYKMDPHQELDHNDIAQQEAAARDYDPGLTGPLVGEKTSSQAITEEYARADPTYVAKTMALPQTYSHYRPIQGDGNCGYRAIAFAYFETLVQCGDVNFLQSELERMNVLNKYIEDVGEQDPSMLELMVMETLDLFKDLITAMSEGADAHSILVARFNDSSVSQCLVYHLRLLACARLKGHSDQYASYLDTDVETYLTTTVMPVNREIDHICVVLVHDILLKPVNIVLDIAYLDRSEGSEVNVHRLPDEANGQDPSTLGPVIYLLYRPGHYDILYRETQARVTPIPPVPAPLNLQINRVTAFVPHNQDYENQVPELQGASYTMNMSVLGMIPGLQSSFGPPSASPSPMTDQYAPSPSQSWVSQQGISAPLNQPSPPQPRNTEHPVRFSKYSFLPNPPEAAVGNSNAYEPTTNTFKNSHFNTAHYNNQNFQPEMYQPDAEDEAQGSGNNRIGCRKRSTDNSSGIKKEK